MVSDCATCEHKMVIANQPMILCAAPTISQENENGTIAASSNCQYKGSFSVNIEVPETANTVIDNALKHT